MALIGIVFVILMVLGMPVVYPEAAFRHPGIDGTSLESPAPHVVDHSLSAS